MLPTDSTRAHCVDPETFAAWVEGGLPAPEAARVEIHLASCARCQAVLAALSATEPVAEITPAKVLPFWSRRPIQWAAAALATAASLTMWTMTRSGGAPPAADTAVAPVQMAEAVMPQASVPPPAQPTPPAPEPPLAGRTVSPRPAPRIQPPPVAVPPPPPVVATPPPPAPVLAAPPPPAAPPPSAVMPPPAPMIGNRAAAVAARQEMGAISMLPGVTPVRAPFEVVAAVPQNAPPPPPSAADAGVLARGAGRGGAGRGGSRSNVAAFTGAPALPVARWRVTNLIIERSVDMGATWELVTADPPFVLNAGIAPFQNVCWLVGDDGAVLRSTNGTSFERMTAPERVDLIRVVAIDALRATVTAIDGRVFETADGGVTWTAK